MLEAEAREQEEKRMAEIQIERIRTNATLDARESESRVRADTDRDRIERILLNEEDTLIDSIQALTSQGNTLPTASSPHVAFSVQSNSGPPAEILLSEPVTTTAKESLFQNQLSHARLLSLTGHHHPGSDLPYRTPLSRNDVTLPSLMMSPSLRPISQPTGHGLGIALPRTNTTVTPSGPTSRLSERGNPRECHSSEIKTKVGNKT